MRPGPPSGDCLSHAISRRGFLKRTAAGAALLLAARMGAGLSPARAATRFTPETLDAERFATLEALCARVISPAEGAPTAEEARIALRVDHELGLLGPHVTRDIRDALTLISWNGFMEGRFGRFANLAGPAQDEVIRGMMESRFEIRRTAIMGLKQMIVFFYYADDRAWKRTGYDGPWVPRRLAETELAFPFPTREGKA